MDVDPSLPPDATSQVSPTLNPPAVDGQPNVPTQQGRPPSPRAPPAQSRLNEDKETSPDKDEEMTPRPSASPKGTETAGKDGEETSGQDRPDGDDMELESE